MLVECWTLHGYPLTVLGQLLYETPFLPPPHHPQFDIMSGVLPPPSIPPPIP